MKEFEFYQDVKCTIWCRSYFTIEAESKEEALKKAQKFFNDDINETDESHLVDDYEWMTDTAENMTLEQNYGFNTIEVYDKETHEIVGGNGKC